MELKSDLIRLCLQGKPKAQHQLYQLVYDNLMRVCMRYAKSNEEAVDFLNQTFMHLLKQLAKYNNAMPFEPWLKRLAVNFILNLLRADKKYRDLNHAADYDNAALTNTPDDNFDISDQLNYEQLLSMIRRLPPMSTTVFNLYVVDGYKHREIGEMLQISENTSKWHLMNARAMLQKMILKMEGTPYGS
jgi:RNA polymerase sigma factor (sigma-70 family)